MARCRCAPNGDWPGYCPGLENCPLWDPPKPEPEDEDSEPDEDD